MSKIADLVCSGKLASAPLRLAILWAALVLYALLSSSPGLTRLALLAAFAVGCGFITLCTSRKAAAIFWLMNTFNGWLRPCMFQCLDHVLKTATPGDPRSVVDAIDQFCWTRAKIMNVGDVKGKIVDSELAQHRPKRMMELGAHMGYSTVRFASQLPEDGVLHSVEPEPMGHAVGMALLRFAGVADKVVAEYAYSSTVIEQFAKDGLKVDCLFIDHVKHLYLSDLKLAISLGVLGKGCVVIADNVLFPGAPDYKQWMLGP